MNCNVTISAEDFKTIHNTLWELEYQGLNGVTGAERIRAALKDAYAQDNDAFDRKNDQYRHWQQHYGLKSIWSIYTVDNMTLCHPYKGAEQVAYRDDWGDEAVFEPIEGNTWADLYAAADRCIQRSGDCHHVFIEDFVVNPQQPRQLILTTGS